MLNLVSPWVKSSCGGVVRKFSTETQNTDFVHEWVAWILGWIVQYCIYTPLWRADEVSELSWWLISAIHDEGLTLCEQLKESWMLQWGQWNEQQGSGMQVGRGLSKDAKALKLGLQHWLEAVSVCDLQSLPFKLFCHPPFYFLLTIFLLGLLSWALQIDPKHRYGHNLCFYFEVWLKSPTREPFYYWYVTSDLWHTQRRKF